MWNKWANYRNRMRNIRQKYFTLLRKNVTVQREKVIIKFRRRLMIGIGMGTAIGIGYCYANQLYSQQIEIKKMKKKFMKLYPNQTYIISFEEDPLQLLREVQITNTEDDQQVKKIENPHCIFINEQTQEVRQLKQKLGGTVIIFSPLNMDELCTVIEQCNKYRHSALVGCYPIPHIQGPDTKQIKQTLKNIAQRVNKQKYIIVDLSRFKESQIDEINDQMEVQTGAKCSDINKILESRGFNPLFQDFCSDISLHQIITNNLPLANNEPLISKLLNLSLVSADGKRFKSSTEVQTYGQIPNLTPLFIGTGGVFAIPAKADFKIRRKPSQSPLKRYYQIENENLSELVLKWRQVRQYISSKNIGFVLNIVGPNKIVLETNQPLDSISNIQLQQQNQATHNTNSKVDYIFSVNNRIVEKILLNPFTSFQLSLQNDLLSVSTHNNQDIHKLISMVSGEGGVLVWCRDKETYDNVKQRIDLPQTGAELMKKIVQIREGIDKKHVLQSHDRYQKYFAKGFFRKITEFFW